MLLRRLWILEQFRAPRGRFGVDIRILQQLLIMKAATDTLQLALQILVQFLISPDFFGDGSAIAAVQFVDELRNEMQVLHRFLDCRQGRARGLSFARILAIGIGRLIVGLGLFAFDLLPQNVQVEVA